MKKKTGAGRPKEASREDKKSHLIREARKELLRTEGAGFSLNRVLEAAGGSKTTLYSYFGGRDGLLEAVLSAVVADSFRPPGAAPAGSAREQLLALAKGTHQAVLSREALALYRLAITEAPNNKNLGRVFFETGPAEARKILIGLFGALNREKLLKVKNPALAAEFFFGMLLEGPLLTRMLALPMKENLDQIAHEAVDALLRAYA